MSDFDGSIFLPDPLPLSPFSYANHDGDLLDNNLMEEDSNTYHPPNPTVEQYMPPAPATRKRRGRPPGSRNRPKPPVRNELAMNFTTINIPIGCCIIDWLIMFSLRNHVGLDVMGAIGAVESVRLRHPTLIPLDGPFNILSLRGTLVGGGGLATSLGRTFGATNPNLLANSYPTLGILVEGLQGLVFGGINGGSLVAAEPVMVLVSTFTLPAFRWMANYGGINGAGDEYKKFVDHLHNRLGHN